MKHYDSTSVIEIEEYIKLNILALIAPLNEKINNFFK